MSDVEVTADGNKPRRSRKRYFFSKVKILILIFTVPAGLVTVMLNPTPKQNLNLLYMVLKLIV